MPEERNRIAVDRLSALLLCPDERSAAQLAREGVGGRGEVVGDVMADATGSSRRSRASARPCSSGSALEPGGYALATVHREANVDGQSGSRRIVAGLNARRGADRLPGPPAHTRRDGGRHRRCEHPVIAPLGYLDFTALASQARVDRHRLGRRCRRRPTGAASPCVTLRPSTEWVDTVEAGANVLVDDDPGAIAAAAAARASRTTRPPLYGDGHASGRIAAALYASRP